MVCENAERRSSARAAMAAVWAAALVLDGAPVFAQRRQAEPEANPRFQEEVQGRSGGGPIADDPSPVPPQETEGGGERLVEPRNVQSVTIGAAPATRATPASPAAPLDTRVTVRVKGAPLSTFLDTISAQAKLSFIITEGLEQKRVTAFLQNVTVREALQVLLEIKGLTYQQIGKSNTYIVTQRSKQAENLITRIYTLSYVPLIPLDTEGSADKSAQSSGTGARAGAGAGGQAGGAKPCLSKNLQISVARIVCTVLSKVGDIELESRTNALIVTDVPEVFPQVEQIIAELDKKAPQVMIEAQIVEIDSSRSRELGFEWGGANGELATFTGGLRDTSFPLNLPHNVGTAKFFDPLNPSGGIISSLGGSANSSTADTVISPTGLAQYGYLKTSVLDLSSLKISLRALVARAEARFLGKPKVLALNNKMATMEISSQEAVAMQSKVDSANGASQTTTSVERFETGVVLKVTPQVNKDNFITMLIQPSFTDVQEAAVSLPSYRVFNPIKRSASTLVRVKNGQTLVLGGLLRSTETKVVRKVPLLGYIPIVGWLFTSTSNRRRNSDLVIFITPTIVSD